MAALLRGRGRCDVGAEACSTVFKAALHFVFSERRDCETNTRRGTVFLIYSSKARLFIICAASVLCLCHVRVCVARVLFKITINSNKCRISVLHVTTRGVFIQFIFRENSLISCGPDAAQTCRQFDELIKKKEDLFFLFESFAPSKQIKHVYCPNYLLGNKNIFSI